MCSVAVAVHSGAALRKTIRPWTFQVRQAQRVRFQCPAKLVAYTNVFTVVAALVFGPTRRSANQTWTRGGGEISSGGASRTEEQNAGLQPYADAGKLREYCQPGDPICAPHTKDKDMSKHLSYFGIYGDEAAQWVIDLAKKAERGDRTSGAKSMLSKSVSHPIANVFVLIFVLFAI
jgi:acetylxylan esterase